MPRCVRRTAFERLGPVLVVVVVCAGAGATPAAAQDEQERARQVYQIFKDICLECHGESAKGNLDLRTHKTLDAGRRQRRRHRAAPAGQEPALSRSSRTPKTRTMPRKKPKLPDADIELIRKWIEDGGSLEEVEEAVADNATESPRRSCKAEERPITDAERQYWAFKRRSGRRVPTVDSPGLADAIRSTRSCCRR